MTRPVPGAGNPLTVPWIRCLDTGKRGYQSRADAKKVIARWQTRDIKRLASRWRAKCPDHPGRPADRCYECRLEIENGDRPAGAMGVARPPMKNLESNRGRLRALLGGKA